MNTCEFFLDAKYAAFNDSVLTAFVTTVMMEVTGKVHIILIFVFSM